MSPLLVTRVGVHVGPEGELWQDVLSGPFQVKSHLWKCQRIALDSRRSGCPRSPSEGAFQGEGKETKREGSRWTRERASSKFLPQTFEI